MPRVSPPTELSDSWGPRRETPLVMEGDATSRGERSIDLIPQPKHPRCRQRGPKMSAAVVKSCKRVTEIFEIFAREKRPLSLKEVCATLNYPSSSASALLKSLTQIGYLSYDRKSMTYIPTTRLVQVSEWIPTRLVSESPYLGLMQRLSDVSGEAVTLCVQSDIHVQYLHVIEGRTPLRFHVDIGTLRPLAHAATGLALLSRLDDAEIEPILRRINFHNPRSRLRIDELMHKIHETRANGYAFLKGTIISDSGAIAFPMPHDYLGRRFAVGVHGLVSQLELREKAILRAYSSVTFGTLRRRRIFARSPRATEH